MNFYLASFIVYTCYLVFAAFQMEERHAIRKNNKIFLISVLGFALIFRLIVAYQKPGYGVDMNCFFAWGNTAANTGFSRFYQEISFCDYPPLYLMILSLLAKVGTWFNLSYGEKAMELLFKLPPVLMDLFIIYFVFYLGKKEKSKVDVKRLCFLLALSPAVIGTSALWGQIDSVLTVLLLLSFYFSIKEKLTLSALFFTLAALIKPQAFLFAPLLMVMFAFSNQVMIKNLFGLLCPEKKWQVVAANYGITFVFSVLVMFLVGFPFWGTKAIGSLISLYQNTFSSYAYATVNALNLNFLLGGNWVSADQGFLFLNYSAWSTIFIAASVLMAIVALLRTKNKKDLFFIAGVMLFSIFMLAAKMHERYYFPAIIFFLIAYLIKRDQRIYWIFSGLSLTYFANLILSYTNQENHISSTSGLGIFISFCNLVILFFSFRLIYEFYFKKNQEPKILTLPKESHGLTIKDLYALGGILLFATFTLFFNLGDQIAPKTGVPMVEENQVTITFKVPRYISKIMLHQGLYLGEGSLSDELKSQDFSLTSVFCWHEIPWDSTATELKFSVSELQNQSLVINELAFYDENDILISSEFWQVTGNFSDYELLFDEQNHVPKEYYYTNSTYFDEIYHARTGYELLNELPAYENTHPHLGKLFIAQGIRLFGMNPFGWRFAGAIFGVLMLIYLYLILKKLFSYYWISILGTLLLAFDFMHLTQSRIATIDTFVVFFILGMFYYMLCFMESVTKGEPLKRQALWLFLSGLFFGMGIATKWTGAYAGAGLFVLYLITFFGQSKERWKKTLPYFLGWGMLFFIVIPFGIYFASFIPYLKGMGTPIGLKGFIDANLSMFSYHSNLVDSHPYASPWYEWLFDIRPIWFYVAGENSTSTIASFGNPIIWLSGFAAMLSLIPRTIKKDQVATFILIGYLAQLLPWMLVPRSMFIYHYFPASVFLILALAYWGKVILEKQGKQKLILFTLAAGILFILYFPVLTGLEAPRAYLDWLKIFPRWTF